MAPAKQPALVSHNRINYLNIFLMLLCLMLAWYKPFEVFIFSFILLGPLHYLTEISWLDKRNYFAFSREQFFLFIPISFLVTWGGNTPIRQYVVSLVFACLVYAFVSIREPTLLKNLAVYFITVILVHLTGIDEYPYFIILIVVLLPTIMHVLVFTGLFMIAGAKKDRSFSGHLSVVIFFSCLVLLLFINPFQNTQAPPRPFIDFYTSMASLNKVLSDLFQIGEIRNKAEVFSGDASYRIMSLISFAYIYHYLNWFSKTEIIGWHRVSKKRLGIILLLWMGIIGFYLINHKTGLNLILCLSLLHVLLEFPLNILTFKQVFSFKKPIN